MINILENKTYTLYLNSNDKISGTNNNATFEVNFQDFLPREFNNYKMSYSFQSGGGKYIDSSFTTDKNIHILNGIMTLPISTIVEGNIRVGQLLTGTGINSNTYILSYGTGTGGSTDNASTATYNITNNQSLLVLPTGTQFFSSCKINVNLSGRTYSFDSNSKSQSITLGYAKRNIETTTSTFSSSYLEHPPKTISYPTQNNITISLYNSNFSNKLLCDTDEDGNLLLDCSSWNLIIEFIPITN